MADSIGLSKNLVSYISNYNKFKSSALVHCREQTELLFPDNAWFLISEEQAAFMSFLIRAMNVNKILEIGTFTGYSSTSFAQTLIDLGSTSGLVVTIDNNEKFLAVAKETWSIGNVHSIVDSRFNDATSELAKLENEDMEFDLSFIDADKQNISAYLDSAIKVTRKGGLIIVDNVLWNGKVVDESVNDPDTIALRAVAVVAKNDTRLLTTMCGLGDGLLLCEVL